MFVVFEWGLGDVKEPLGLTKSGDFRGDIKSENVVGGWGVFRVGEIGGVDFTGSSNPFLMSVVFTLADELEVLFVICGFRSTGGCGVDSVSQSGGCCSACLNVICSPVSIIL